MLRTGAILRNKYCILHTLGKRGLSGHTYLAEDIEEGTNYAIKELNPNDPENYLELCVRFRAEADYLRRLDGFNGQIPKFHESFKGRDGEDVEREYIVQEYIEGKTLAQFAQDMKAHGWTMSESQVKEILSQLLTVVSHIHQEGFIHRDIKPENIILREPDRVPVLIDYGAVKEYELTLIRKGSSQTNFIGTLPYSDEDQQNGKPTAASDLYALGVVAVYLLTKTPPQAISKKDGKLLWDDHVLGLSKDFSHVVDKAVEPRSSFPGQRFGSADAMLAALNQVASAVELEEELTRLATRQSRDAPAREFVKCRECTWYLRANDTNCADCGVYNLHCLTEDEAYLFNNVPGKYVDYVKDAFLTRDNKTTALLELNRNEYNLITNPVDVYIRKHTSFLTDKIPDYLTWGGSDKLESIPGKRPFRITLGEYLEAHRKPVGYFGVGAWIWAGLSLGIGSLGILEENKISLCFSPFAVIIVVLVAVSTRSLIWKLLDSSLSFLLLDKKDSAIRLEKYRRLKQYEQDSLRKKLHANASSRKEDLERRVQADSIAYRVAGFCLKRDETSIKGQLTAIGTSTLRLSRLADMLDRETRETPAEFQTEDQKRDRERTSIALQHLALQSLKYDAKLQEIELLRLNNAVQAEVPRQQATPDNRNKAKQKIDQMAKLSDKMYTTLKKADLTDAGSEWLWFERIRLIREAVMKLNRSVTSHIVDLVHQGHDDEAADFPVEVTSGLDRLSVYLTNQDFDKEYRMLQAKYEK